MTLPDDPRLARLQEIQERVKAAFYSVPQEESDLAFLLQQLAAAEARSTELEEKLAMRTETKEAWRHDANVEMQARIEAEARATALETGLRAYIKAYRAIRGCSPQTPWEGCEDPRYENPEHYDGHHAALDGITDQLATLLGEST